MGVNPAGQFLLPLLSNSIADAAGISILAALITVARNWTVHGPSFHIRYLFVGSDLVIGFLGIGLLLLVQMVLQVLTKTSTLDGTAQLAIESSGIVVAAFPLFIICSLTERLVHTSPSQRRPGALSVNLISGAVPLFGVVLLAVVTNRGF